MQVFQVYSNTFDHSNHFPDVWDVNTNVLSHNLSKLLFLFRRKWFETVMKVLRHCFLCRFIFWWRKQKPSIARAAAAAKVNICRSEPTSMKPEWKRFFSKIVSSKWTFNEGLFSGAISCFLHKLISFRRFLSKRSIRNPMVKIGMTLSYANFWVIVRKDVRNHCN